MTGGHDSTNGGGAATAGGESPRTPFDVVAALVGKAVAAVEFAGGHAILRFSDGSRAILTRLSNGAWACVVEHVGPGGEVDSVEGAAGLARPDDAGEGGGR